MNYKLTAEEIDERAGSICRGAKGIDQAKQEIKQLIADCTGVPVPEVFDESKVVHGSVWYGCFNCYMCVILKIDGKLTSIIANQNGEHCKWSEYEPRELAGMLQRNQWKYLGRYDFAAGLKNLKGTTP